MISILVPGLTLQLDLRGAAVWALLCLASDRKALLPTILNEEALQPGQQSETMDDLGQGYMISRFDHHCARSLKSL